MLGIVSCVRQTAATGLVFWGAVTVCAVEVFLGTRTVITTGCVMYRMCSIAIALLVGMVWSGWFVVVLCLTSPTVFVEVT